MQISFAKNTEKYLSIRSRRRQNESSNCNEAWVDVARKTPLGQNQKMLMMFSCCENVDSASEC